MKKYLKTLLYSTLFLTGFNGYAQGYIIIQDAKGEVVSEHNYVDVQGTAFLNSDWLIGSFTLVNNKLYKDVNLKYDVVQDKIFLRGAKGEQISMLDKVKDFTLNYPTEVEVVNRYFRCGYSNIPGTRADSYFEVLADGKVQLLKRTSKIIQENKEYNSATITKSFYETIKYYLFNEGKATLIKKDKKSILTALNTKQPELETYIKDNKLNLKNDEDLAKLITYYNTL